MGVPPRLRLTPLRCPLRGRTRALALRRSCVRQSHYLAHVAHRLLGELARALAAVGDDCAHQRRIVEVFLRALLDRFLLGDDGIDHRLLAFEAADACSRAALLHPSLPGLIGIDFVPGRAYRAPLPAPPDRPAPEMPPATARSAWRASTPAS